MLTKSRLAIAVATALLCTTSVSAKDVGKTDYTDPMMSGDTSATSEGWKAMPIYTIGESARTRGARGGYLPPGIPDGMAAFPLKGREGNGALLLVNHELTSNAGYAYTLANGTEIPGGARVSFFEINKNAKNPLIKNAGLAYDTIYDRAGNEVTDASQLEFGAFNRFCSARGIEAGEFGMVDDLFLTGEETGGGTQWILDVAEKEIWAAPAMGRGAWEGWTPIESGDPDKVALLGGDDREAAPLYLYVGDKNAVGDGSFLDRNGLATGKLYCWKANDESVLTSAEFSGTFTTQPGTFVEVANVGAPGSAGYDDLGYAMQEALDALTGRSAVINQIDFGIENDGDNLGCFAFSRPEDLHSDPAYPNRAVFASTGRDSLIPADSWGTIYIVDTNVENLVADVKILHDGDDDDKKDFGIRSPDNLTWAKDGKIYVQEDRSVGAFGMESGIEASMWQLSPITGEYTRIAEMCRDTNSDGSCFSVAPDGSTDGDPTDLGDWESSGVIDVTHLFRTKADETLLLFNVQAHSVRDGLIGGNDELVQGGQLIFLSNEK